MDGVVEQLWVATCTEPLCRWKDGLNRHSWCQAAVMWINFTLSWLLLMTVFFWALGTSSSVSLEWILTVFCLNTAC